jgi:NTE family protein
MSTTAGIALVLGSGGARAAYEVGVARFLFEDLHQALGQPPGINILCGTSAGAVNALGLAAFADRPLSGVAFLSHRWRELQLSEVIRPRRLEILRLAGSLIGCSSRSPGQPRIPGSILDPRPLRRRVLDNVSLDDIARNLRRGHLQALSFSATEVATGRAVVFQQRRATAAPVASPGAAQIIETRLTAEHALASAAIPLLFPAVRIAGRAYCDGALRQSVPLSPALHLGAEKMVVVSTQHLPPRIAPLLESAREQAVTNPLYLLGRAVNALTLDRIDDDLERLTLINQLLEAGGRLYGPTFLDQLNLELGRTSGRRLRLIRAALVRPSQNLGSMAAEYLRSRLFQSRAGSALAGAFRRLAAAESEHEAELASYLLFDGPFLAQLMDLGYADARAQRQELIGLLRPEPSARGDAGPVLATAS